MALRDAFCPNCGQPTQINDTKEFCFCLACGSKIQIPKRQQPILVSEETAAEHNPKQRAQEQIRVEKDTAFNAMANEEKMKEVEFYYKLSSDKKEYVDNNSEPLYYIKGQDVLVDLSQQYPSDYRVWWEMCKPMDFAVILAGEFSANPGTINMTYFEKALDLAPLDMKMELIKQHDSYLSKKNSIMDKIRAEQSAKEAAERAAEEERQKLAQAEEEKRLAEERRRMQEEQAQREQERIEAEQRAMAFEQKRAQLSIAVWNAIAAKNYSCIDDSYFELKNPEGVTVISVLKVVANILYLTAYHIDEKKNNQSYLDQSLAVHFGNDGTMLKFDNKPVIVRGWPQGNDTIRVQANPNGGCMVNDIPLIQNQQFVLSISKNSKKPLMALKKIFS